MNAHAMVGPFTQDFNTTAMANQINQYNFSQLPIFNGNFDLGANQALYLYGGRQSLLTAIAQVGNFRIVGDRWVRMALFRTRRKVAGGTKTKQLLVIAPVPNGIPAGLRPYLVPVGNDETWDNIRERELTQTIQNLSK